MRKLAICVATYKRPAMLERLVRSLNAMQRPEGVRLELRIIDNDRDGSARSAVAALAADEHITLPIRYRLVSRPNIAAARNAAVEMGGANLVMFIDDDEVAHPSCLGELLDAFDASSADAVVGWVGANFEKSPPTWMTRGGYFDHPTGDAGAPLDWRGTRCGCTLVCGSWFYDHGYRFDFEYGRSGGEDVEFFARLADAGATFCAAPEAIAIETIPEDRMSMEWLVRRAWRAGLCYECVARGRDPRSPMVRFAGRSGRAATRMVSSIPSALTGRPEGLVNALRDGALAGGGLVGWLRPRVAQQHACYGASS